MQAGQPITFNGTSANRKIVDLESIASSNPLTITASKLTVSGDVDIQGVLNTVTGTETVFEDTILVLNQSDTSGTVADTSAALVSGIEINRSGTVESSLKWEEAIQLWKLRGGNGLEVVGDGGNIGITTNDSQGNANITFNHARGDADQDGNAGRIEVNVDRSGGEVAYMDFEVGDNVAQGTTALYPTLRLRDNGAIVNRPTLEIDNNLWIDGGVGSGRGAAQSLDTAYSLMKGQIRFDNTHSDTARGPNKIVMHDNGSSWISGFGASNQNLDSYSGAHFRWSRMEGPSATPVQKMQLDSSGNLEVTGKMTIGTGPTDALDVATKSYVDSQIGGVDLSTCAIKSETNTFTADQTISGSLSVSSGSLSVSGRIMHSMPADCWYTNNDHISIGELGRLYTAGAYRVSLTSNGYRDDNNLWQRDVAAGVNGKVGAAQISLDPGGYILFETEATKNIGDDAPIERRMTITREGDVGIAIEAPSERLEVNGNIKATNMLIGTEQVLHTGNLPVTAAKDGNGDTVYTFNALA